MVAISSSQKKTVFAVILLALIAAWVMISGRGGFSGLRSDVFNNPSFVCTNESLVSGEVRYSWAVATIQNLSNEKTSLQAKVQWWSADIRKNEAQIKKLEKEETAAEKKERALEVAVKKQCTPRALATCAAKKQELQDIRQEIKKIRNSLVTERNQNKNIKTNIQSAESSIKLLEKQIQEIQNFKEDFYTCKMALEQEKTEVASFDLIVSGEVFVNEPFDMTVRALDASGKVITDYKGKIFFDSDIFSDEQNPNLCSILGICPVVKIASPHNWEYTFTPTDKGIKLFEKWWTISPAGVYNLTVFELNGPNGGIGKTVKVVAKNRNSAATCTDSDGGINLDIKGFGYDGIKYSADNPVYDHCHPQNANTVRELYCREDGVINNKEYTCPYGCSEGACIKSPSITFAADPMIGSAITVSSNQRIAKIAVSNSSDKNVTFHAGNGNRLSVQFQVIGDNTNGANETIILKDQDGTTLDTGSITSATGLTQIDFDMSSVGVNWVVIPAFWIKNFYLFMDTSDLEDNGDSIQAWFDNEAADVTFGINGSGAFALGNIVFPDKLYGPILSRSI